MYYYELRSELGLEVPEEYKLAVQTPEEPQVKAENVTTENKIIPPKV